MAALDDRDKIQACVDAALRKQAYARRVYTDAADPAENYSAPALERADIWNVEALTARALLALERIRNARAYASEVHDKLISISLVKPTP